MLYDCDGYSDYTTAQLTREHVRVEAAENVSIVAGGRNGGGRLQAIHSSGGASIINSGRAVRAIAASPATLHWGHYITVSTLGAQVFLYDVRDATNSHVLIAVNTDGSLVAFRSAYTGDFGSSAGRVPGDAATQLGITAPGIVTAGQSFAFKATVTVDDATGAVSLFVNGIEVLTLTNQNTRNGGTATITNLLYGAAGRTPSVTVHYEDFWCGSVMLPGDRRVDSHLPIADGANTDFTPSAGSDHFEMVNEATPDDDTTTVTATAVNSRDTYKVESFKNPGGTIDGVVVVLVGKRADANSAQLATCIRSGGANHDGTPIGITTIYGHHKQAYDVDPGTTAAWAETAFGAAGTAEFGQHKAA
jgi:hypothetical protein